MNHRFVATTLAALAAGFSPIVAPCAAQGLGGFNLFSTTQDIEIGKQSALEAEKKLSLLNDVRTDRYLNRIVTRLAGVAPGSKYPYAIKAVNSAEINAFALPGGPMYVNTGLIAAARSEAELAGVLAHEMSHVALRHGTQQASTAYVGQAGLGILGGLFGKNRNASQIVGTVGGLGLNTLFLRYSRDDEYKADASGASIMAKAGYDPMAMASLLSLLRTEQGRDPSKLEVFFSDHPGAAERESRIRTLAPSLTRASTPSIGSFAAIQSRLGGLATASAQPVGRLGPSTAPVVATAEVPITIVPPSARFVRFTHSTGFIAIDRPDNWAAYQATTGNTVSIAPEAGVVQTSDGRQHMVYGMIVSHYEPFATVPSPSGLAYQRNNYVPLEDRTPANASLQDATNDLVATLIAANPTMKMVEGSTRSEWMAGAPALSLVLTGVSDATCQDEQIMVFTRGMSDGHVVYVLAVMPTRYADQLTPTFIKMVQSLAVNATSAHRSTRTTTPPAGALRFKRP